MNRFTPDALIIVIFIFTLLFVLFVVVGVAIIRNANLLIFNYRRRVTPITIREQVNITVRLSNALEEIDNIEFENHYKKQKKINQQIQNNVIFINPDDSIQIGVVNY